MVLNYGHTLAHALEAAAFGAEASWDLRHGEAVAIGLVFAARLARRLGRIDDDRVALHRRVVGGFDLPSEIPAGGIGAARWWSSWPATRRRATTSPSSSTGPKVSSPCTAWTKATVLATLADMGCAP